MKVKELIERLRSLDPELEVYLTDQEETQLTRIDVVIPCEDFGENDREEFVAIFPKSIPNNSSIEKLEHRNLSQETANCDKFTLTAEEAEIVRRCLQGIVNFYASEIEKGIYPVSELELHEAAQLTEVLNKIIQWQDENNRT